jgi:hypothetical protein
MAKDAYRATNFKNEYPQMTAWLNHHECVLLHDKYIRRQLDIDAQGPAQPLHSVPTVVAPRTQKMAVHPSSCAISIDQLALDYCTTEFESALKQFVIHFSQPTLSKPEVEHRASVLSLPFQKILPFHRLKFVSTDPYSTNPDTEIVVDSVHCEPVRRDQCGKVTPGRFDMVLVKHKNRNLGGLKGT